jgi:hypothetical protein
MLPSARTYGSRCAPVVAFQATVSEATYTPDPGQGERGSAARGGTAMVEPSGPVVVQESECIGPGRPPSGCGPVLAFDQDAVMEVRVPVTVTGWRSATCRNG